MHAFCRNSAVALLKCLPAVPDPLTHPVDQDCATIWKEEHLQRDNCEINHKAHYKAAQALHDIMTHVERY